SDLLERKKPYVHTYEIYEEMVQRWLQRERVKNKKELRKFSEVIACNIYENQGVRGGLYISPNEISQFAQKHNIQLEEIEMRSRSLLNRNAEDKYKFAHRTILEYLLSLELIRNPSFRTSFNFENMEQTLRFYKEQVFNTFISQPLKGIFMLFVKKDGVPTTKTTGWINIKKLDLKELINVAVLDLNSNQIDDITALSELKNIQLLNLSNNQITDITPLKGLKNIESLRLYKNQITDITPLMGLKSIQWLSLNHNQISDITHLKELIYIQLLELDNNLITDITPLTKLKNIESLYMSNNQITKITALTKFNNIRELRLNNNQITDITPLAEIRDIQTLNVSNNQITNITALMELKNLKYLHLSNNPIDNTDTIMELRRKLEERGGELRF
ncbi:MAG: leucine-rich repeat domain-containing protein, partial [bacterium]|nr:leucine-rich repeat domain-containing protein [bacterium]